MHDDCDELDPQTAEAYRRMERQVIGHAEDGEAIYQLTPDHLCPSCGDYCIVELPDGQQMCGWCDILVGDELRGGR